MIEVKGHCEVSSNGARLLLKQPILFDGAASEGVVTFSGLLNVEGLAELEDACLRVEGSCKVATGAVLWVENCSNVHGWMAAGGGLAVVGALQVDGQLEVHASSATYAGGGLYVTSLHLQGELKVTGCFTGDVGGAIYASELVNQTAGRLLILGSRAQRGAGIFVRLSALPASVTRPLQPRANCQNLWTMAAL